MCSTTHFCPAERRQKLFNAVGAVHTIIRRWSLSAPTEVRPALQPGQLCPACQKIKAHSVSGELHVRHVAEQDRGEVLRLLRNEAAQAREKNPLERIMRLAASGDDWMVETTTEKLAQRLGRSLRKARGGKVDYAWSHNNKFVRVVWEQQ
jgi:NMD protein affecting ribosome stability and mRNA decay